MAKKSNPILASYEAKLEAKYRQKLTINSEMEMIAHLLAAHEELGVGPGRAEKFFNTSRVKLVEISDMILDDSKDDKEILVSKRNIAKALRDIFGAENWQKVRTWFPLVREYWEI